jgi:hypothetical protein
MKYYAQVDPESNLVKELLNEKDLISILGSKVTAQEELVNFKRAFVINDPRGINRRRMEELNERIANDDLKYSLEEENGSTVCKIEV